MLFRSLLTLFFLSWILLASSHGQELASYRIYKALPGEKLSIQVESAKYPDVIRSARHGSLAKFKYSFESQYRVRYQSSSDFRGLDTVILLAYPQVSLSRQRPQLEGLVLQVRSVVAEDDYYMLPHGSNTVTLSVMANDRSDSEAWISDIVHVSSGTATIGQSATDIRWTAGAESVAYIIYRICNGHECAEARVQIKKDQEVPSGNEIYLEAAKNEEVTFLVPTAFSPPANHFISGSLQELRPGVWHYEPAEAFVGMEIARFHQIYNGALVHYDVNLSYKDPADRNGWCTSDIFYTELDNELTFSVVDNDVHGDVAQILSGNLEGSLAAVSNGVYRYTPKAGFNGQTSFDYVSCKELRCDTATVQLVVHNFPPLKQEWHFIGDKGMDLRLPYDVPIDQFEFRIDQPPQHGTLTTSSRGQTLRYSPIEHFVGYDFSIVDYCTENGGVSNCQSLVLYFEIKDRNRTSLCELDCVYPGDLNNDGLVTVGDVLPLGIHLGMSGPSRQDQGLSEWYGRSAKPWIGSIPMAVADLNSVDADGNGAIEISDLEAMTLHYGKAHRLSPAPPPMMSDVPIRLELVDPAVTAGEEAVIDVIVGSPSHQVQDMLGFNFSAIIDGQFVDSSSLRFDILPGGLVAVDDGILAYSYSPLDGQLDVGFSKFDEREIEGYGVLGQIKFIVEEDLNGFRRLPDLELDVLVDEVNCLGSDGSYMRLPSASIKTNLQRSKVDSQIAVYPSPANRFLNIDAPFSISDYQLIDVLGNTILQGRDIGTSKKLSLEGVPMGVYFLRLRTTNSEFVTKIQVAR